MAKTKTLLVRDADGRWQMLVDDAPYLVKGVEYSPDPAGWYPVGSNEWMSQDTDGNGLNDAAYDSWVDYNNDNFRDANEDAVGDFRLLKDMGCNTVRIYHSENLNRQLLRDLHATYGIRVILGNFAGAYTLCSGAEWCDGTDYRDPRQRANMLQSIRRMVEENKDEPYVLMYMLGNENDALGSAENSTLNNTNAVAEPEAFATFIQEACVLIKSIDHDRPVGVCLSTYRLLPYLARWAPDVDVIGMNAYTGAYGFGTLWNRVKEKFDRPVLITEYGVDCYDVKKNMLDEGYQALYHRRAWQDILANSYWGDAAGNAIGGVAFSWMDKWWLCGSHRVHDTDLGAWKGPTKDGYFSDEWLGICGQGDGKYAPFMRQLRSVYDLYRDTLWHAPLPEPYAVHVPENMTGPGTTDPGTNDDPASTETEALECSTTTLSGESDEHALAQ